MLPARFSDQLPATVSCQNEFLNHLLQEYFFRINRSAPGLGIRSLFFDQAENTLIISNIATRRIHLINLTAGTMRWHDHHQTTVRHVIRYGNEIISSSWDGTVRAVDFYSLSERLVLTQRRMGRSPFVTVSPDGKFLFSFSYDVEKSPLCQSNIVRQWSYHTGDMLRMFSNTGVHKSGTRGGACMPVGHHLYTLSNSGYLNLFDLRSGRLINETSIAEDFRTMCVIPERNLIIASDTNGSIYLYHINHKRILASWKIHQNDITCIKVYPGNPDIIVTCSFDGFVKIWELPEFNLIEVLPIDQHELWSCEFIGNLLAVGSTSGFIYFYDLVDLSAISLKARMFLSKQAYVIFPENSTHFYCNDSSLLSIKRKEDDSLIIGKHADYLFELFNSRNVLDRLFGGDDPLDESGGVHPKLIRQIPANLTRQQ